MLDDVKFDESHPFVAPYPTTTTSDLLRIVEEIQERKRLLDMQMLAVMPNLISNGIVRACESIARSARRSGLFYYTNRQLVDLLPPPVKRAFDKDGYLLGSCFRTQKSIGAGVQGILLHLDFQCLVVSEECSLRIEISW
jgi:hypothetical protein